MDLVAKKVVVHELGDKEFLNMYLVFELDGKEFRVRVRPVFWRDMGLLRQVYQLEE